MAFYQPPTPLNQGKFNPVGYEDPTGALTIEEANTLFLRFPTAQGTENFGDANVVGTLTAGIFNPANVIVSGELTTTNPSTYGTTYGFETSEPTTGTSIHNTAYGFQCAKTLSTTTGTGGNTAFGAIAMPSISGACNFNTAVGHNALWSLTTGDHNTAVGGATQTSTITTGVDNTTVGYNAKTIGNISNSVAVGASATSSSSGTAVGRGATAGGAGGTAVGNSASATGLNSCAFGLIANATVDNSIAIGNATTCAGIRSVALGYQANAQSLTSISIGDVATTNGEGSIAIGDGAQTAGIASIAIGRASYGNGVDSIAIGDGTQANGTTSVAIGAGVVLSTSNTIQLGTSAETVRFNNLKALTDATTLTIGSGTTAGLGNLVVNTRRAEHNFGDSFRVINVNERIGLYIDATQYTFNPLNGSINGRWQLNDGTSTNNIFFWQTGTGSGGVSLLNGATAWSARSDIRLKRDIEPIDMAVEKMMELNPVLFNYNKDEETQERRFGFIAQEVREIFPQLVREVKIPDEDAYLSLETTSMIPYLVKAIQELKKEIEELKSRS